MKGKIVIFLLLALIYKISAQNYQILDSNFVEAIKSAYPNVITGDSLIIAEANKITGYVSFAKSNIRNIDGIQFFTGASNIDLNTNQIDSVPDLDQFDHLKNFTCYRNNIEVLPALPKQISKIYAFGNRIKSINELVGFDSLIILHVSENQLTEIPSLSNFPLLEQLHCDRNKIKKISDLDFGTKLLYLFAWENKIESITGLSNNTVLQKLYVNDNLLKNLPTLINKPDLVELQISANSLTFEDIYPLMKVSPTDTILSYGSMEPIENQRTIEVYDNEEITIRSQVDTTLSHLNYELIWNNTARVAQNSTGKFIISSERYSDGDFFSVKITSSLAPDLTLIEKNWFLKKIKCEVFLPTELKLLQNDCSQGADIKLIKKEGDLISNGVQYSFQSIVNNFELDSTLTLLGITQGEYVLTAVYKNHCTLTESFVIPNAPNCDKIFSPNNDGQNDTYFFDHEGEIKIYNIKGDCVKTLVAPVVWDGSDDNGQIVPLGYYTIIINEKDLFHLTVMK